MLKINEQLNIEIIKIDHNLKRNFFSEDMLGSPDKILVNIFYARCFITTILVFLLNSPVVLTFCSTTKMLFISFPFLKNIVFTSNIGWKECCTWFVKY